MRIKELKFEVHDTYLKNEKITTIFKAVNDSDVKNRAYLDEKFYKINGHLSFLEIDYNE